MGGGGGGLGGALGGGLLGTVGGGLINTAIAPVTGIVGGYLGGQQPPPKQQFGGYGVMMPDRPTPQTVLTDNGTLQDKYRLDFGKEINANTQGLEAIRNRALSTGPSAWANQALAKQGLEQANLRNQVDQQGQSALAQARFQLASKYGLSKGASERLATQGMRDQFAGAQGVANQGALARANIGLQDEQIRNQFLSGLPGQEIAQAGSDRAERGAQLDVKRENLNNIINGLNTKNAGDLNAYNEQMRAYAAAQQGQAMANSGGGGKK